MKIQTLILVLATFSPSAFAYRAPRTIAGQEIYDCAAATASGQELMGTLTRLLEVRNDNQQRDVHTILELGRDGELHLGDTPLGRILVPQFGPTAFDQTAYMMQVDEMSDGAPGTPFPSLQAIDQASKGAWVSQDQNDLDRETRIVPQDDRTASLEISIEFRGRQVSLSGSCVKRPSL